MTMSDPIADMLTRIRNANTAKHDTVDVPASKMKIAIANILLDEGYIAKYDLVEDGAIKTIHITLKYGEDKNEKIITGLKRISKPGLRVYAGKDELPAGYLGKAACYLPGDSVSITNPNTGITLQILNLGTLDASGGIAILISEESAKSLGIEPGDGNVLIDYATIRKT